MATYVNLDTIYRGATGINVPTLWYQQVNDNFTSLNVTSLVIRATSTQSLVANSDTLTAYNQVEHDPLSMYNASTQLFTIPMTGVYHINIQTAFTGTSGQVFNGIYINASSGAPTYGGSRFAGGTNQWAVLSRELYLSAATTVGVDSWSTVTNGVGVSSFCQVVLVSPS